MKHAEYVEVAYDAHVSELDWALEAARSVRTANAKAAVVREVTCPGAQPAVHRQHAELAAAQGVVPTGNSLRKPPFQESKETGHALIRMSPRNPYCIQKEGAKGGKTRGVYEGTVRWTRSLGRHGSSGKSPYVLQQPWHWEPVRS